MDGQVFTASGSEVKNVWRLRLDLHAKGGRLGGSACLFMAISTRLAERPKNRPFPATK